MDRKIKMETLFDIQKEQIIIDCLRHPFPGTIKWVAEHPIWDCCVYNHISPKQAWYKYEYIQKAVDNLFWIVNKSIKEQKYETFVKRIEKAFKKYDISLYREILNRFTIAKIAPKVTALKPTTMLKIIEESGIDLTQGVYCPMAGFGGIVEGTKEWFKKNNKNSNIEAYDINKNFCDWYGWKQRDVLEQHIITDKIVIACPPFGENTEQWKGTPKEMYYDFHTWCNLIQEYIKAPNYILIGPETNKQKNKCGLFSKTLGVQWYSEYSK